MTTREKAIEIVDTLENRYVLDAAKKDWLITAFDFLLFLQSEDNCSEAFYLQQKHIELFLLTCDRCISLTESMERINTATIDLEVSQLLPICPLNLN